MTSFGWGIKTICNKISHLSGLRTLNIYIGWNNIIGRKNDRLAVEAFKLLLFQHVSTPDSTSCFVLKQASSFVAPYARFKGLRDRIESLGDSIYIFAILAFVFRRRSPEVRYRTDEDQERLAIENLVGAARGAIGDGTVEREKRGAEQLIREQELGLRVVGDGVEEIKYPIPFTVLERDVVYPVDDGKVYRKFEFAHLNPRLKINVFDCPVQEGESNKNRGFQSRILNIKDPAVCAAELVPEVSGLGFLYEETEGVDEDGLEIGASSVGGDGDGDEADVDGESMSDHDEDESGGDGEVATADAPPEIISQTVDARLMTHTEISEKLDEVLQEIDTLEEAALP